MIENMDKKFKYALKTACLLLGTQVAQAQHGPKTSRGAEGFAPPKSVVSGGEKISVSNFPIEDAVTCSSDPTAKSGIELNFLVSKGLVRISEWSRPGRTDLKSYISVLENPGPSDHNIDVMAGDFKNYFFMRSGRHNHVVEVLVSQAVLGGGDTASGAVVSKGLAVVTDVEGITEEEVKTKYSLSCSEQP